MTQLVRLLAADGTVMHEHRLPDGHSLNMPFGPLEVAAVEITQLDHVDPIVVEHLRAIISAAAAAVYWRDELKRPHLTTEEQVRSFKAHVEVGTIIDTLPAELRVWLRGQVPATVLHIMEGG